VLISEETKEILAGIIRSENLSGNYEDRNDFKIYYSPALGA